MPNFQALHPRQSIRRLRTALGPFSSPASTLSNSSRSPLSSTSTPSTAFGYDLDNVSTCSLSQPPSTRQWIRANRSPIELQQEEEQNMFALELAALIEPRPRAATSLGGIAEVLAGRV